MFTGVDPSAAVGRTRGSPECGSSLTVACWACEFRDRAWLVTLAAPFPVRAQAVDHDALGLGSTSRAHSGATAGWSRPTSGEAVARQVTSPGRISSRTVFGRDGPVVHQAVGYAFDIRGQQRCGARLPNREAGRLLLPLGGVDLESTQQSARGAGEAVGDQRRGSRTKESGTRHRRQGCAGCVGGTAVQGLDAHGSQSRDRGRPNRRQ